VIADQEMLSKRPNAHCQSLLPPYGWFSLILLLVSVATLIPSYLIPLLTKPSTLSSEIILHGIAFIGWYALVVVQSGLVARRHFFPHRIIGYFSIPFVLLLAWSGAAMLLRVMNSYQDDWTEQYLASRTSFVWAILHTLIFFVGSYILAIVLRTRPAFHMRFMLLASLSMIAPSITRVAYLPMIPIDGTAFTLLVTYGALTVPILMDRCYEGRVHAVFKIGIPAYAVTQLLALGIVPATSFGRSFAFGV